MKVYREDKNRTTFLPCVLLLADRHGIRFPEDIDIDYGNNTLILNTDLCGIELERFTGALESFLGGMF